MKKVLLFALLAILLAAVQAQNDRLCTTYDKNGASPVTDEASCEAACCKGEGICGGGKTDFKGVSGAAKCGCKTGGSTRDLCLDTQYVSAAAMRSTSVGVALAFAAAVAARALHF
uniref:Uncharacterized protein n=2 Tax=Hemiselmis andersenii TaxID=464988 RepID=A0A7S0TGX4_HEMAN|mmetsp:Transcript_1241/g.3006  ORF Transcript_1241/g.3006 Transcript_1241/m.3006 type:complete len:115 (+) Transcript_1241:33-377(+)